MTEEQAWKLFNDEMTVMTGADKAERGIMAVVAAARAEALEELRARVMSLEPNDEHIVRGQRPGFRNGHGTCRYAVRDLVTEMLAGGQPKQ